MENKMKPTKKRVLGLTEKKCDTDDNPCLHDPENPLLGG